MRGPRFFPTNLLVVLLVAAALSGCVGGGTKTAPTSNGAPGGTLGTAANGTSNSSAVNHAPHAGMELRQTDAALNITAGQAHAVADKPVDFAANGSADPDNDPLDFTWGFGDGQNSSGAFASHAFSPGSYAIDLHVSDGRGGSDVAKLTLNVTAAASNAPYEKFMQTGTLTMTTNMTNPGWYSGGQQGDYKDKFFPVKPGAKLVQVTMTYTKAPTDAQNAVYLDLNLFNAKGEKKWTQGSSTMPMTIKVPEADILANGFGTWKAQASCFTCAQTSFSFEVRVYYQLPT